MSGDEKSLREVSLEVIARSKPTDLSDSPDEHTEDEQLDLKSRHLEAQVRGLNQDIDERKKYANRNYWLIVGWLAVVNLMLVFQGFRVTMDYHSFNLTPPVLLTVVGSTTASVVGIFVIVTKYLFPKK